MFIVLLWIFLLLAAEEVTLKLYCERAKIEDGQAVMVRIISLSCSLSLSFYLSLSLAFFSSVSLSQFEIQPVLLERQSKWIYHLPAHP